MKRFFVLCLVMVLASAQAAWANVGEEATAADEPMVSSQSTTDDIGTDAPTLDYDSDSGD